MPCTHYDLCSVFCVQCARSEYNYDVEPFIGVWRAVVAIIVNGGDGKLHGGT